MKRMGKTWVITALCAAASLLSACGKEEPADAPKTQSRPEIKIVKGEGTRETDDFEYQEENGEIVLTRYIGRSREITIPDRIEEMNVVAIGSGCFHDQDIIRVVCPDTVREIGSEAFAYCGELEEMNLNEGLQNIGYNAFMYCSSLEHVRIPDSVVEIADLAFAGSGVKELEFMCGSAETWGEGVFGTINAVEVTIPAGLKIVPCTMFEVSENLETVVIESGIEQISVKAFIGCGKLKRVSIPASVTEIGERAFENTSAELVLYVESGSYAERYAKENGIAYENVAPGESAFAAEEQKFYIDEETAGRIEDVEDYYSVVFPEDYFDFIAQHNVYEPTGNNSFTLNGSTYVIDRFLGFVSDYTVSPLGEYDIMVVMSPIDTCLTSSPDSSGAELIPVVSLSTGDYVCLNFKEDSAAPSVCVWSCGESEEFHPVVYKAADSFSEFLAGLE